MPWRSLVEPLDPTVVIAEDADAGHGTQSRRRRRGGRRTIPSSSSRLPTCRSRNRPRCAELLELAAPGCIVRPLYKGTPGHPVGFAQEYFEAAHGNFRATRARAKSSDRHSRSLVQLWTDDAGVVRDVDRPPKTT